MMLPSATEEASRRGYQVIDMGARVIGDVDVVAREWGDMVRNADARTVVVGVGEVTVQVEGGGQGGRCQEFAWLMAKELSDSSRPSVFVATSLGRARLYRGRGRRVGERDHHGAH